MKAFKFNFKKKAKIHTHKKNPITSDILHNVAVPYKVKKSWWTLSDQTGHDRRQGWSAVLTSLAATLFNPFGICDVIMTCFAVEKGSKERQ